MACDGAFVFTGLSTCYFYSWESIHGVLSNNIPARRGAEIHHLPPITRVLWNYVQPGNTGYEFQDMEITVSLDCSVENGTIARGSTRGYLFGQQVLAVGWLL
jgi:hypothetical protein